LLCPEYAVGLAVSRNYRHGTRIRVGDLSLRTRTSSYTSTRKGESLRDIQGRGIIQGVVPEDWCSIQTAGLNLLLDYVIGVRIVFAQVVAINEVNTPLFSPCHQQVRGPVVWSGSSVTPPEERSPSSASNDPWSSGVK
jgi:hypothetical protein